MYKSCICENLARAYPPPCQLSHSGVKTLLPQGEREVTPFTIKNIYHTSTLPITTDNNPLWLPHTPLILSLISKKKIKKENKQGKEKEMIFSVSKSKHINLLLFLP